MTGEQTSTTRTTGKDEMNNIQDRPPLLSVIAVTWNAKRFVDLCLRSLAQVEDILLEVIVVDNASTDGTPELIAQEFKSFKLIRNNQNLGFAKANNIGIRRSRGKYVCLVNSDVVVPKGCFSSLVEFMEANPRIGMAGPQMLAPDGTVSRSTMRFPSLRSSVGRALALDHSPFFSRLLHSQLMGDFPHDRIAEVEVLNGWFWMIRREALDQVGLLDEDFFIYGEDVDWCRRFWKRGWRVAFYPFASAVHFGAASSSAAPVRFYVEQQRANFLYWGKHHGRAARVMYRSIVFAHNLLRLASNLAIYLISAKRRQEAIQKIRRSWAVLVWMMGVQSKSLSQEKATTVPLATA
jgi:GT2 family glycosyltransferase